MSLVTLVIGYLAYVIWVFLALEWISLVASWFHIQRVSRKLRRSFEVGRKARLEVLRYLQTWRPTGGQVEFDGPYQEQDPLANVIENLSRDQLSAGFLAPIYRRVITDSVGIKDLVTRFLERNLHKQTSILSFIAATATSFGLAGTLIGLLGGFTGMADNLAGGGGDFRSILLHNIGYAMTTTLAGLFIQVLAELAIMNSTARIAGLEGRMLDEASEHSGHLTLVLQAFCASNHPRAQNSGTSQSVYNPELAADYVGEHDYYGFGDE